MSVPVPNSILGKRSHDESEQGAPPESNKLFQCSECGKSYSRVDHLARHVRLHTKEKPYPCTSCGKCFARADLLKRHVAGHDARGDHDKARSVLNNRPGRVSKACEACAELHLRCDEQKPCTRCRKKATSCVYSSTPAPETEDPTTEDSPSLAKDLPPLLDSAVIDDAFVVQQDAGMPPPRMPPFNATQSFSHPDPSAPDDVDFMSTTSFPTQHINEDITHAFVSDGNAMHDFLHTIMGGGDNFPNLSLPGHVSGTWTPRNVFEFGQDTNLELDDLDLGFLNDYNHLNPFAPYVESPETTQSAKGSVSSNPPSALGGETLQRASTWRFRPVTQDNSSSEQQNLSLPAAETHKKLWIDRRVTAEPLSYNMRDRIIGIVVSSCKQGNVPRSLLCFPSLDLLDSLLQFYLSSRPAMFNGLFHLPTLRPSRMRPELVAAMIAAGATLTPDKSLQKVGLALQESLRVIVPQLFEENNSLIADLDCLQAMGICLDIGMWSGNSRKMEIAESFLQPFVTMVRRRGWFLRSAYEVLTPLQDDHGKQLEDKWESWIKQESRMRLVYFYLLHSTRQSIALFASPLVSYAELALPLPAVKELWLAPSALAWKSAYLSLAPTSLKIVSVIDLLQDVDLLSEPNAPFDRTIASEILLSAVWGLIWDYRQLSTIMQGKVTQWSSSNWLLSSRLAELTKLLDCICMSAPSSPTVILFLELYRMHLHASLEAVHLFAGAEGHEEARRVYPVLQEWAKTSESRTAVAHAGQTIAAARKMSQGTLRDFLAIAVYQSSLTLWSYGVLSNAAGSIRSTDGSLVNDPTDSTGKRPDGTVILDGVDTSSTQRFIAMNRGQAAVSTALGEQGAGDSVLLSDPGAVMGVLIEMFKANHKAQHSLPPLVSNLTSLMDGLRSAVSGP